MMPCRLCSAKDDQGRPLPVDDKGRLLKGLKQKGKTRVEGTVGHRRYVCQDCGANWTTTYDTAERTIAESPMFTLVDGGADA